MERHILREGTSSCPISSSGIQGVPTLSPPCKPYHQRSLWPAAYPWLDSRFSALCLKSDHVVITWSPPGYTPVEPDRPDALSFLCLLITMWQLVKAHWVTRNEPKIHVVYRITSLSSKNFLPSISKCYQLCWCLWSLISQVKTFIHYFQRYCMPLP